MTHPTEILSRRVPGQYWVRLGLSFTGRLEPGHRWLYYGIIRRDAWRLGRVGIYLFRMPRQTVEQALARVNLPDLLTTTEDDSMSEATDDGEGAIPMTDRLAEIKAHLSPEWGGIWYDDDCNDDLEWLVGEVEGLRGLLARLEWAGQGLESGYAADSCCPICKVLAGTPHSSGCELAAALGHDHSKAEAERTPDDGADVGS